MFPVHLHPHQHAVWILVPYVPKLSPEAHRWATLSLCAPVCQASHTWLISFFCYYLSTCVHWIQLSFYSMCLCKNNPCLTNSYMFLFWVLRGSRDLKLFKICLGDDWRDNAVVRALAALLGDISLISHRGSQLSATPTSGNPHPL